MDIRKPAMTEHKDAGELLKLADLIRSHIGELAPACNLPIERWDEIAFDLYDVADRLAVRPQAAEPVVDEVLSRLVDWTYLHALEGQAWPSTKTKDFLISMARIGKPTQHQADAMKLAASPTPDPKCHNCGHSVYGDTVCEGCGAEVTASPVASAEREMLTDIADEIEQSDGIVLMLTGTTKQLGIRRSAKVVAALRALSRVYALRRAALTDAGGQK